MAKEVKEAKTKIVEEKHTVEEYIEASEDLGYKKHIVKAVLHDINKPITKKEFEKLIKDFLNRK